MSDFRAIAAVTRTLHQLLDQGVQTADSIDLAGTVVTTLPLDKARDDAANGNQLNLFLYQTLPNAAWRNRDMPGQTRPGETGPPPLALNLHYLITAFGKDNDSTQPFSHQLLGRAMSVLHDHPVLSPEEIANAFAGSKLENQIEPVRLTWQPLPVEDIFKLWSGFQTQYRLSVAYEVSVVLIESTRRTRAPLPVLGRGRDDRGVQSQASPVPAYPTIDSLTVAGPAAAAEMGQSITLVGHHLDGQPVQAWFRHRLLPQPLTLAVAPQAVAGGTVDVVLPADGAAADWAPGLYGVTLSIGNAAPSRDRTRNSNEVSLTLAPKIVTALPLTVQRQGGAARIELTCSPPVLPQQRVALLLGDRELPADPHAAKTDTLGFTIDAVEPGEYFIRLRVDGVDSVLVGPAARPGGPPTFKDHKVVIR
ncbi:conserved hypothetical protein [Rubrivivax sp. A210]|uniref:DUF4255 domain-containing protein n=1 Tax=Rubrivivax sp. A210 TaxID=2772301 RepID=UPI001919FCA4|nr:DUF4255 domain-containing protein [Rubrivivax sp. A210]CAD5367067.1 conserved hypothetical protein [Rubrivivax sp. A210]